MKIALIGHYGSGNLGDEAQRDAIRQALIEWGHDVTEFSLDPDTDLEGTCITEQEVAALRDYDAVVFGGGLLFMECLSPLWWTEAIAKLTVPIFCCGVGVEALSLDAREAYLNGLQSLRYISWREATGPQYFPLDGPESVMSADLAWLLPEIQPSSSAKATEDKVLTITAGALNGWLRYVPELVGKLREKGFIENIRFMNLYHEAHGLSDHLAADRLRMMGMEVDEKWPSSPQEAIEVLADSRAVLACRRHGAIFASLAGIRPVVISDHPRLTNIHHRLWPDRSCYGLDSSVDQVADQLIESESYRGDFRTARELREITEEGLAGLREALARAETIKRLDIGMEQAYIETIRTVKSYTMVAEPYLRSLWQQVRQLDADGIPGALVECGVWRGRAVGVMAAAHRFSWTYGRRHIHLFDSFQGLPQELLNKIGYPAELLHWHEGWIERTVPEAAQTIGPIALLRLDVDWYASTKICLEHLYPLIAPGGYLVVDDYLCWPGCKRAVDEYLATLKIQPVGIPCGGILLMRKPRD